MTFENVIEIVMPTALTIIAFFLKRLITKMDEAVNSINDLNKNMAVVMSKGKDYDKRLDECEHRLHKHANRITKLEASRNGIRG
jgi:chromosome segregation ATPase